MRSARASTPRVGAGRRALWRRARVRRVLAALCVGIAAWISFATFASGREASGVALVAAGDLAAGHRVEAADLRVAHLDPALVPPAALADDSAAVGQVLAAPVSAGEFVTRTRLRPAASLASLPPSTRAIHVPLPDIGSIALVRPGDRVDLVAVTTGAVVGSDLLVLAVDAPQEGGSGLAATGRSAAAGLVVAVPPAQLTKLVPAAVESSGDGVHLVLR